MIKRFLMIAVAAVAMFAVSCNNDQKAGENVQDENIMTVDQLKENIANLVDSNIVVTGEVDHVCKHGGTKMVIFNPETDASIHILAGESGNFRADEVKDRDVIVYGIVEETVVDEAKILELEEKLAADTLKGNMESSEEMDKAKDAEHHGDDDVAPETDQKHKKEIEARIKQINALKDRLAKAKEEGKDHLSFYNVVCTKYTVVEDEDSDDDGAAAVSNDEDDEHHHDAEEHDDHDEDDHHEDGNQE